MPTTTTNVDDDLNIASDRLNGAEAIAAFRGEPVFRTRYLIRKGLLPVAREGQRIVGRRCPIAAGITLGSGLRQHR